MSSVSSTAQAPECGAQGAHGALLLGNVSVDPSFSPTLPAKSAAAAPQVPAQSTLDSISPSLRLRVVVPLVFPPVLSPFAVCKSASRPSQLASSSWTGSFDSSLIVYVTSSNVISDQSNPAQVPGAILPPGLQIPSRSYITNREQAQSSASSTPHTRSDSKNPRLRSRSAVCFVCQLFFVQFDALRSSVLLTQTAAILEFTLHYADNPPT